MSAIMSCTNWYLPIALAERVALVGVRGRGLEAGADHADGAGGDGEPALVERVHGDLEALALLADAVLGRDLHVGEEQLAGRTGPDAELVRDLPGLDARPMRARR